MIGKSTTLYPLKGDERVTNIFNQIRISFGTKMVFVESYKGVSVGVSSTSSMTSNKEAELAVAFCASSVELAGKCL